MIEEGSLLEEVQACTAYNPFNTILVTNTQRLPDLLFVLCPPGDRQSSTTPLFGWVLCNLSKLSFSVSTLRIIRT